ncbi:acetyl-CoA C-acyltransferase [Marivivens sp. JLT3646]|jgi:acetyl-CoA C-acetyltransferase|uniref:acetyl-CoA C-acyltransferase n=1 Tax=Marivivens sp. JLT3646 TaxID=1920883 RepID=UPI0007FE1975|nr:acetyl-CoA C-acyltransferase [Marivivens sp. JLT3646]APO88472.1 acetyl-CoA acetyltransferase [Marivivens sp. JLT3646]NBQ51053.1 acetyl-CoA C-acyltransferase [Marivivens sp.]OBR39335.1 acetyl-CoA acetyltransferase [Donghicola sp. JL3646]
MDPIVIVSMARTPMGGFMGSLSKIAAPDLGASAIAAAVARAGIDADKVDQVIMGNVLPAGLGQAPARQASMGAGLPLDVRCQTVGKVCGSGMQAIMNAHDMIKAGSSDIVVAGGMESMSGAPYLLEKARTGYRAGHGKVMDHMFLDGLEDAYDKGRAMGTFAEECADTYGFTREEQDAYALRSLDRAKTAIETGAFDGEIVAVGDVTTDEQPGRARPEKIPTLKPAFRDGGTVTAANSSSISDGAAALVLTRKSQAEAMGLTPIAVIHGHAGHAQAPSLFTTAPIPAMQKVLAKVGWTVDDVDLFEINEAFAVVAMAAIRDLGLDDSKVNVNGGACALGHPIGCSGARIVVTLIAALQARGLKKGVASLCIGGGEATALAVELL